MSNGIRLKDEIVRELWLPKAREARSILYPKRKKHARMRMLTLSDGINMNEIFKLEEENMILREESIAWVSSMIKRSRVEAENVGLVIDGPVYDPSFLEPSCPLTGHFPFDILNLDFGSQDTDVTQERIEKEIEKLEKAVGLQKQNDKDKFLVIFTVRMDSSSLDVGRVARRSDAIRVNGWEGLRLDEYPEQIVDPGEKTDFIQAVIGSIIRKYGYRCRNGLGTLSCSDSSLALLSVAGVLVR